MLLCIHTKTHNERIHALTELPNLNIFTEKKKNNDPNYKNQKEEEAPIPPPPIINKFLTHQI